MKMQSGKSRSIDKIYRNKMKKKMRGKKIENRNKQKKVFLLHLVLRVAYKMV